MSIRNQLRSLQPNVGFLLKQASGYSRTIEPSLEAMDLDEGVLVERLSGELGLTRTSQGIWVDGTLTGTTRVDCARCLSHFSLSLVIELQELFYYPPSNAPGPSDYVITEDGLLDLVEPMREQIVLNLPMSPRCQPDCKGICSHCGQDRNLEACDCEDDYIDPRLAALKDLISND